MAEFNGFTPRESPELPDDPNSGNLSIAGNGSFGSLNSTGITTTATIEVTGTGISTDGTTTPIVIDASTVQLYTHTASFTGTTQFQISNLTNGRWISLYIRNTNSTSRSITVGASETESDFTDVLLSRGTPGFRITNSTISLLSLSGTASIWVANIEGQFVGHAV